MEREDILRVFDDTIRETASNAGARFDDDAGSRLHQWAWGAANAISELEERQQESAIGAGADAYRKFVGEMVRFSRTAGFFPSLNRHALDTALGAKGPNPPFWA